MGDYVLDVGDGHGFVEVAVELLGWKWVLEVGISEIG